jgi:transposase-like protein
MFVLSTTVNGCTSLAEEEEKTLTFYDFPQTLHRSIRTTNAIESL